jgi:hypothetical protein
MAELFVGAVVAVGLYAVVQYAASRQLVIRWWHWLLTVLGFLYLVFVLEVIVSFLREGSTKAAMVNGAILGFFAVVWGVLLGRFAFSKRTAKG